MTVSTDIQSQSAETLHGRRAWLITDGKKGMDVQCAGVADALGLDHQFKHVTPTGLRAGLAPWGGVQPSEKIGQAGSRFCAPWPEIAIATGRQSIPYIRAIKRLAGPDTFTIVLQDPKRGPDTADLIWVPTHDQRRGANVITSLTAPHSFSPDRLKSLRENAPAELAGLPKPCIAVVLGGGNSVFPFGPNDDQYLAAAIASLAKFAGSFLVTPSRRTSVPLRQAIAKAVASKPNIVWDEHGDNPYLYYLALADALIVTGDSVNMTGEACATGKPVYVYQPAGGSAKFRRFHQSLRDYGATRPLPKTFSQLENWCYEPLDSAQDIASEIHRRWRRRREDFPNGWAGSKDQ